MESILTGFLLSLSLIIAIGAQNAFVLKQGLKKHHIFWVCLVCAMSDSVLIFLGIAGFGAATKVLPALESVARYGGAIFLLAYGIKSFISAFRTSHALVPAGELPGALSKTVLTIATQYEGASRLQFGAGAIAASVLFFFSLGYGARFLAPLFQRPVAWKILDFAIGLVMFAIATSLVLG